MSFSDKFFKRDKDEYSDELSIYKDEPSTGKFASFLFGFFALFVTLLIAGGLFFGGRAVYRAVKDSSSDQVAGPQKQKDNKKDKSNSAGSNPVSSGSNSSDTSSDSSASGDQGAGGPSSTPSTGDNLPATGDTLPNTGDTPQSLPKTGDPGM